jgi:hypothetical protein
MLKPSVLVFGTRHPGLPNDDLGEGGGTHNAFLRLTPRRWGLALSCLAVLYLICLGRFPSYPAFGDDNSIYLVSAESLAHGTGYRLINYLDAPPSTQYPIGYPFLLSLVLRVLPFGLKSIFAARLLTVCSALVWVEASRRLLLRVLDPAIAACAALVTALAPEVLNMTGQIMSDLVFAAILLATLVLAGTRRDSNTSKQLLSRAFCIGLLAASSMLVRTIGLALVGGIGLEMLLRRRWSEVIGFSVAISAVLGPWMFWCVTHHGGTFDAYTAQNTIAWRTPFSNFWALTASTAPAIGFPPFETRAWTALASRLHVYWVSTLFGVFLVALVVLGWAKLLRDRHTIALVLAPYMAIVLLWWWEPDRFVIPVLPLIVFCAAVGAKATLSQVSRIDRRVFLAIAIVAIIGGLAVDSVWIRHVWRYGHWGGAEAEEQWAQMKEGLDFIKRETPNDAEIISSFPAAIYLFTGRHTLGINVHTDLSDLISRTALPNFMPLFIYATERRHPMTKEEFGLAPVRRFIEAEPGRLKLKWASRDGHLYLYEVTKKVSAPVGQSG